MLSEEYQLKGKAAGSPGTTVPQAWRVRRSTSLPSPQLWWAFDTYRTKCGSNWQTFHQEYPVTAEVAFITSGERFFNVIYPHVKATTGYKEYGKPQASTTFTRWAWIPLLAHHRGLLVVLRDGHHR
jgi:hypothetical protein